MIQHLLLLPLAAAASLYATHYSGSVYTLSLDASATRPTLRLAHDQPLCGGMPSWLTLDPTQPVIYCSDETGDATTNGTLSALTIGPDGRLAAQAKTSAPGGGVHSVIYAGDSGRYLAIAHYGGSAVSTYRLPLRPNDPPLQVFRYRLSHPGAKPQQDAPHPHQVLVDPTGGVLVAPDLGADLVRVYAIDRRSGRLAPCPGIAFPAGEGPRHGVFVGQGAATTLYVDTELGGHVFAFAVSYGRGDGCPAFRRTQAMVPYPGRGLPAGASLAEIRPAGEQLYVSVRTDQAFAPDDSLATLDRSRNGTVSFRALTSSRGKVPRTFVVNAAGDRVAIGNQASATVVVVRRDVRTGALGAELARLQVGQPGQVGTSTGLSSVIWVE
ncbi:Lactonase, 7-bladed beta-propeller-domain-containing protein [Aspergillus ambiguus]|uniref:Lactonase, 7-bladed beta-propeller-domain-containing protein n=1 Tax=Aspergillus ambiguus TaxID=176160 RepID=UPI003CCE4591